MPDFADKNALEYASFSVFQFAEAAYKLSDDSWWVNHMSGYEHGLKRVKSPEEVVDRYGLMVRASVDDRCRPRANSSSQTLACVPFFGGQPGEGNTGSSHSKISRALKLKALRAVLCSLFDVASVVVVGVCNARDKEDVEEIVTKVRGEVLVPLLDCAEAPAYLPYRLLVPVQKALRRRRDETPSLSSSAFDRDLDAALANLRYVIYDEADQPFYFDSPVALASTFAMLDDYPQSYVVPQRFEKRYGTPPESLDRHQHFNKAMNKCQPRRDFPLRTTISGKVHLPSPVFSSSSSSSSEER